MLERTPDIPLPNESRSAIGLCPMKQSSDFSEEISLRNETFIRVETQVWFCSAPGVEREDCSLRARLLRRSRLDDRKYPCLEDKCGVATQRSGI